MRTDKPILVVGAGLAGLRAAEALRGQGWRGLVRVVGAERHMPYTRPPLSKQFLAGDGVFDEVELEPKETVSDVEWSLETEVLSVELAQQVVVTAPGESIKYCGLIAATGVSSRRLPIVRPSDTPWITLRTLEDAQVLRAAIAYRRDPRRVHWM